MLTILSKYISFIAVGVIGYLTYSALNESLSAPIDEYQQVPVISKKMISPVFIEPKPHTSPVGRDPFVIVEDGALSSSEPSDTRQVSAGVADDREKRDFSGQLMGVVIGNDGRKLALIGGEICSVGSLVELSGSDQLWQLYAIEDQSVVLRSNKQQTILRISNICTDYNDADNIDTDATEAEKQKESVQ